MHKPQYFMKEALKQAKQGQTMVHPNPMVGCVIVKDGKIIAKGYHKHFGGYHAERNAILACKDAKGADLYVNLEPCSHWGKTPPCTELIIKSGIKKVYVSNLDPNPLTSGVGIKQLKKNGVEVVIGLLKADGAGLNKHFIESFTKPKRRVVLKLAMTMDGKIATKTGNSKWITSEASRKLVHKLRAENDGILVGVNTINIDNPGLTAYGLGYNPVRVVVDVNNRIKKGSKIFDLKAPTVIFTTPEIVKEKNEKYDKTALIYKPITRNITSNKILKVILKEISKMGINSLLIEGGGEVAWSALKSGVVDELYIFVAPIIIGGRDAKSPVEGEGVKSVIDALKIKEYSVKRIGRDTLFHCKLK